MMRTYLILAAAAFAATPALAQMTNDSPYANRNTPGTGTEQRDDNVWQGAIQSQEPAPIVPYVADPYLADPYLATGRSAVVGPPPLAEPYDSRLIEDDDDLPPSRALPGSDAEQRDENVWFGGDE